MAKKAVLPGRSLDGPYACIENDATLTVVERGKVEGIMVVGMKMQDKDGGVCPFHIPPAVALAILRAIEER